MGKSQSENHSSLAFELDAVPNTYDLKLLLPTVGYAFDCVEHQRASEPVDSRLRIVLACGEQVSIFLLKLDPTWNWSIQFTLGALYRNEIALDTYLHSSGHRDWLLSNSRHNFLSVSRSALAEVHDRDIQFCGS